MILVTGGAGFIGSNLVAALQARGLGPLAVSDRLRCGVKWRNLALSPLVTLVPPEELQDWLLTGPGRDVRMVFHLGACSSTTETDADHIWRNNVRLSLDLWDWCVENGARLVYASSAATYGDGSRGFRDDNIPDQLAALRPLNPYGWSKQVVDCHAVDRAAAGKAPRQWAGLKFFNVYGPNEDHKGGQRSVVVQLFEQIRDSGRVRLFRSHNADWSDGGQQRDFVHVDDCVAMMLRLYDRPEESGIFNCGSGVARSFGDLALAVFAALGRLPAIDYIDMPQNIRAHYQYYTCADMSRARAAGIAPPATALEEGVRRYVQALLARPGFSAPEEAR